MEFCQGCRVDDYEQIRKWQLDVDKVSHRLGTMFSEMIFTTGFVHCDPHPGNVLINPIDSASSSSLAHANDHKKKTEKKKRNGEFEIVLLDHGLYQTLSETFRYRYAQMWMAILENDMAKLERLTSHFNISEYFSIFSCIITGRSWTAINNGIANVKFSVDEVSLFYRCCIYILMVVDTMNSFIGFRLFKSVEIKSEAGKYLREISEVLNRVPREMLLLLKTNDLLRGIETCLKTRASSSSLIYMSKCCVRLVNAYERKQQEQQQRQELLSIQASHPMSFAFAFAQVLHNMRALKFRALSYLREISYLVKIFSYELFLYAIRS